MAPTASFRALAEAGAADPSTMGIQTAICRTQQWLREKKEGQKNN
ncbi:hypothetical protein BRADI_2g34866v3 [Brachypodium distachyon]|uniref:Uncharacterized protein n=1 Tax=Brachypodium distachyon TaxID=15368 RepID=A0A2K2DBV2_BRADI|nr:hypothetical protein BRADI_2g34866v3 [Brachypodium distachyon]